MDIKKLRRLMSRFADAARNEAEAEESFTDAWNRLERYVKKAVADAEGKPQNKRRIFPPVAQPGLEQPVSSGKVGGSNPSRRSEEEAVGKLLAEGAEWMVGYPID